MLLLDNIKEIAYQTDYFTTIKILGIFTKFNNDDFWTDKWIKMYTNENYVECLTRQDNFLIKERKDFAFIFYDNEDDSAILYKNILYEAPEDGSLQDKFQMYSNITEDLIYVYVDVKKQFIVFRKDDFEANIIEQFDKFNQAEDYIESDIIKRDATTYPAVYQIIDMEGVVVCFDNVKMERKHIDIPCNYKYYSRKFKRSKYRFDFNKYNSHYI